MAEELYKEWFVRMRFPGYKNTKFLKGLLIIGKSSGLGILSLGEGLVEYTENLNYLLRVQ